MKKTILSLLMLTIVLTSSSFGFDKKPNPSRAFTSVTIPVTQSFSSLVMKNINVVLTQDENGIRVEGERDAVQAVKFDNGESQLTVTGARKFTGSKRVTVFIPASEINKIQLYGDSKITSNHHLSNENIDVYLEGDCSVNLKSYGTVNIDKSDDYMYDTYEKNFTRKCD